MHLCNSLLLLFLLDCRGLDVDGWMNDFRFYVLFNSHIRMVWKGNNEKLCAMEPCLRLERIPPTAGLEPGTAGLDVDCGSGS